MALLKAFVCQVFLLGMYKLFLEQAVEEHLVPDEFTRNCLVGFICLLCLGIQLYTENVEDQTGQAESPKTKSRRRSPPDTAENVSEFLDEETAHMMKTLDAAMQQMNQMPMSEAYVQNIIFAAAGPGAAVIEQTFAKQPDAVVIEEIHVTKLDDVTCEDVSPEEPIVIPAKVEEVEEQQNDNTESEEEEEVEEEEVETKSDVCEEEEDVVTVIDASKSKPTDEKTKPEVVESEEEEEEEEEEEQEANEKEEVKESITVDNKKKEKIEKSDKKALSVKVEAEEEEEEEESEDEQEDKVKQDGNRVTKKS